MTTIDKIKASKAKCKRHRDNWKRKALAYLDIIERARKILCSLNCHPFDAIEILDEAGKLDKEGA